MAEEAKRLIRFNFKSYLADEDRLYDTNIVDALTYISMLFSAN